MKISIVIPSLNQGRFLERTIKSIVNQSFEQYELIVMDGGSADNSLEVISAYEEFITFYESKSDGGQTNAVNKGMEVATGDIIGWLNSDDVYYPETLSLVSKVFDNRPDINVIYGKADHIDEGDKFIEAYKTEPWNYEKLKSVCFLCQPAVFFRKSMVEKYGPLDESLNFCMDYEYWLRIGNNEIFYYLDKKLAGSRLYPENKTLGSRLKVHAEIIRMFKEKLGVVPNRWIAAHAHYKAIENGGISHTRLGRRKYMLKMAYFWNKDLIFLNRKGSLRGILLDIYSALKGDSKVFNDRLKIEIH